MGPIVMNEEGAGCIYQGVVTDDFHVKIEYNQETKVSTLTNGKYTLIEDKNVVPNKNGNVTTVNKLFYMIKGYEYVPLRVFADAMGCKIRSAIMAGI